MNWIPLTSAAQLDTIKAQSHQKDQVIFKHSTRCGTSSVVLNRLERAETNAEADFYFLDLLAHRELSNRIAEDFRVYHESPQLLLIRKGECVYDESHLGISMDELLQAVSAN